MRLSDGLPRRRWTRSLNPSSARAGHPLTRPHPVDIVALHDAAWVLSRPGAPSRELFDRAFFALGQTPPVPAVETGDLAVLRGILLESNMLTAISAHQLRYEIRDGSLVALDFRSMARGATSASRSAPAPCPLPAPER